MSTDRDESYKVTISGNGVSVDREVDQETARAILNIVLGGATSVIQSGTTQLPSGQSPVVARVPEPTDRSHPPLALREFLAESAAKSNPEKIVVMGEYVIEHQGVRDFSREEIKLNFRTGGEAIPKNLHRDFNVALSNGWIAEDPQNQGRFYVTRTGKQAIEQRFSSVAPRAAKSRPSTRRTAGQTEINGNQSEDSNG